MNLPPITEEDKPAIESMIKKLVRFRKRQAANSSNSTYMTSDLTSAIKALHSFGEFKGWWEINFDI